MSLHRIVILLLLVLPFNAGAQQFNAAAQHKETYHTVFVHHESRPLNITSLWRYHPGDNPAWASPAFNDSSWVTRPALIIPGSKRAEKDSFPGVAWFRIYLAVDTVLAKQALALTLVHGAKAEYYLDGLRLNTSGATDSQDGESPFRLPVIFTVQDTAPHLLAIRFSNPPGTGRSTEKHRHISFTASVNTAPAAIQSQNRQTMTISSVTVFFFSFFFAFALIHLVLFLFYRSVLSNLWFSLFCLGLGCLFLAAFLSISVGIQKTNYIMENFGTLVVAATCASLSALVNYLFGWGRMRYRIAQVTLLAGVAGVFISVVDDYVMPVLIVVVFIEAIVLIIRAISRRMPGARIIGAGVIFFALTIIFMFFLVMMGGSFAMSLPDTVSQLIAIDVVAAIVSIPLSMSVYLAWNFAGISKNLGRQLTEVERLSDEARQHEAEKQQLMQNRQDELEQVVSIRTEELRGQKEKSDELLRNILPAEIAEELKDKGSSAARMYDSVSVLFTDFADFTQMAESLSAQQLVAELDQCFSAFDAIITRHGLEKIKTVGDAYIAVSGLPAENPTHAYNVVMAALEIQAFMQSRKDSLPGTFSVRLGIHSGPVIAGIVGVKKFAYDIWGDTVNTAARMEQHSEPGKINISAATHALIRNEFNCRYRGELEAKHKGRMGMYFVEARAIAVHDGEYAV